jgi:hypothetical protein
MSEPIPAMISAPDAETGEVGGQVCVTVLLATSCGRATGKSRLNR